MARHLRTHLRVLLRFEYQQIPDHLDVIVDSDFVGIKRTRKSTNGGYAMHGTFFIESWSTTQAAVAMSSGEAEYYGTVKGAREGLEVASLYRDLTGLQVQLQVNTDPSAAPGIAMHRGVEKARHFEVRTL